MSAAAEQDALRCETCGQYVLGITTTGPGEHQYAPCGCRPPISATLGKHKRDRRIPAGHTPEVPVPLEHRGKDTLLTFDTDDGIHLVDATNSRAWIEYDGPITEMVQ